MTLPSEGCEESYDEYDVDDDYYSGVAGLRVFMTCLLMFHSQVAHLDPFPSTLLLPLFFAPLSLPPDHKPSSAAAAASGHPAASSSASSSASFTSGFTSGKYGGDASNACFRMGGSVNAASTLTVGGDTTENGGSNPLKAEAKAEEGEEAEEAAYSMGLYDSAVPAKGVYVRYTQGNSCHRKDSSPTDSWTTVDPHNGGTCNAATFTADGERHCTRSLQLNFLCHNTQREVPSEAMVAKITAGRSVDPYDTCAFEITLESVYGCPTQCPLVPTSEHPLGAVCADHGRCAYGSFRGAHCVCSEGREGLDCAASTTSTSGAQEESGGDGSAGNNNEAGAGEDGEVVQRDPFESSSSSSAASSSSLDSSNRRLLSLWWVLPLAFLVLAAFISGRAFLKWRHNRNDPQRSYEHVPTFEDFELIGAEGQRGKAPAGGRVEGGNPLEDGDEIGSGIF